MNRDDIIRMANEANICQVVWFEHSESIERFARLVAAHERERLIAMTESTIATLRRVSEEEVYNDAILKKIVDLGMTIRTTCCLVKEDIDTVGKLIRFSEIELLKIPNFGRKALREVRFTLEQLGLKLRNCDGRNL